jgi:hypothetical protein
MKTILLSVLGVAVVAAVVVLAAAARQPDSFRIQRSAAIRAPAEAIFPYLSDFHRWRDWSPYETLDADLKRTYAGAEAGQGAVYEWSGAKAGAGRMEIAEAAGPRLLRIRLDFFRPFRSSNIAEFTLQPDGDATRVTWAMSGPSAFMTKVMGLFFDMDRMIGRDFETGLATLKARAEQA